MKKLRTSLVAAIVLAFLLVPLYAWMSGDTYALTMFGRILVFALAALGLNLALGFGGMVSLGHAMYIGLGAYSVAILSSLGIHAGWLHLVITLGVTGIIAGGLGWVALRTHGIAFIMITLAFAQLAYFFFVGLKGFGGDEGMRLEYASNFGPLTGNTYALYLATAACVMGAAYAIARLVGSRFGLVLRATKYSERRVNAVGTSSLPYRLLAYVISGQLCALSGYFLVNLTGFVSPAYMAWTVSGELIVMVLLGGLGTVFGPVIGATALLLVEEVLKTQTEHWPLILGPAIVLMVAFLQRGLWGLVSEKAESASIPGGHA